MTVVNGNAMTPSFTVGNGDVLKTQFVAKVGNDYYYRVYATGTPGPVSYTHLDVYKRQPMVKLFKLVSSHPL